jgi:hypothetical protein
VGDPSVHVNRVSFPGELRGTGEPLMQIEFAVPALDEGWPADAEHWRRRWLADCRKLGLIGADHRVEEFDFRSFRMHYNGFGAEGEPLRDADPALVRADSNLWPVVPSMANLNLNRYVACAVAEVTARLAGARAGSATAGPVPAPS